MPELCVQVALGQVLAQLGQVLHFAFPSDVQTALNLMAVLALDVSSLAHVDCLMGDASPQSMFYALWLWNIAGLPLALLGAAALYCTLQGS